MTRRMPQHNGWAALRPVLVVVLLCTTIVSAQTKITPPKNKYTPEQDVELGRQAAAEVRQQYPVITNDQIAGYLTRLGDHLVEVSPPELNHQVFEYSFTPVNLKEINAFALPGGPMFVNRGMFEAASGEGEVVGVMAHELAHVLLRHGTANATKAQNPWLQIGALGGAIAGAIVGGAAGSAISSGSQFGLGTLLLKYSREYEKQADLLGAQIMARAGYDPRDLARMFETIERQSRREGPEWLSSHPNPGNRTAYITQEAAQLQIASRNTDGAAFDRTRQQFASLPAARSMADVANAGSGGSRDGPASVGTIGEPVPPPSSRYRDIRGGEVFRASVPDNWRALSSNNSLRYVPENAYGQWEGRSVWTHGVEFGLSRASSRNLRDATNALLDGLARGNPDLRMAGEQRSVQLSQRSAIGTPLVNRTPMGTTERIHLYTTFLADGNLFYYIAVAPDEEFARYDSTFRRVGQSIRLTDR